GGQTNPPSSSGAAPPGGPRGKDSDAASLGLPLDPADAGDIAVRTLVTERRFVALSTRHPLAGQHHVSFAEIADEPFAALPLAAGPLRDFWLATRERAGKAPTVAAEVTSADETFEIVSPGAAGTPLPRGNAA